jgi:hypothetical protein
MASKKMRALDDLTYKAHIAILWFVDDWATINPISLLPRSLAQTGQLQASFERRVLIAWEYNNSRIPAWI